MPKTTMKDRLRKRISKQVRILSKPEPQSDLNQQTQVEPFPRPWRIEDVMIDGWNCFEIRDATGKHIVTVMGFTVMGCGPNPRACAETIVRVVNSFNDLLEALRVALNQLQSGYETDGEIAAAEVVKAALAKAESHS